MNLLSMGRAWAAAVVVQWAMPAAAAPITYSISGIGSGHIGSEAFRDAAFTLAGTADTDALAPIGAGVSINPLISMQVDVSGHGSGQAVEAFDFFVNNTLSGAGFLDELVGDVLDVLGPDFLDFDGISALGPSAVNLDYLASFGTTAGEFQLDDARALLFTAVTNASTVPVPGTLWLMLGALMAAGLARSGACLERVPRLHSAKHQYPSTPLTCA